MQRYAAAAASLSVLAGCSGHHVEHPGPAGLAYACSDGATARILYDGGDPNRVPARLDLQGRQILLRPAPAMTGLRYEADGGLVWWSQGDEARLSEAAADGSEREIARCTRVREGGAPPPPEHGDDH
jgi:membrane-bound inhibitor of C-type lysozyme